MKLFVWRNTSCNKLYSHGDIVAAAETIEEARATVLEAAKTACIGYCDMRQRADELTWGDEYAKDAQEEIDAKLAEVRKDIEAEPVIHEVAAAVFFNGGE